MRANARRDQAIAWSFVGIQALLLIAIVALPRNTQWVPADAARTISNVLFFTGVAVGAWAFLYLGRALTPSPLPNRAGKLVVKGPYAIARHPIYTGVIILSIGITVRSGSYLVVGATVALMVLFAIKARWEEKHLASAFPGYSDYMTRTGRFVPYIGVAT
ncbi:MAG: isoprenylcysteine carboxylmethyltransferase family protein [Actinomycetota bacterium]